MSVSCNRNEIIMKQNLVLLFLLISIKTFTQSYKVIYDLNWKKNKETKEYSQEYFALLLNNNKKSDFLSYIKFKSDSAKTKNLQDLRKNGQGSLSFNYKFGESKFNETISKNYAQKEVVFEKQLFDKIFNIKYNCDFRWKISEEKSYLLDYPVQKATTEFGGRTWVAWFTTEIPIQDGPYKFYGLPGLILKISDLEDVYIYEIKSIVKEENDISERNFGSENAIKISSDKWSKIWNNYKKEPSSILGFRDNNADGMSNKLFVGGDPNSREFQDNYNKKQNELLKNFVDPIELIESCN